MRQTLKGWGQKLRSKVDEQLPGGVEDTLSQLGQKIRNEGAVLPENELVEISSNLIRGGYSTDSENLSQFLSETGQRISGRLNDGILSEAISKLGSGSSHEELEGRFGVSGFLERNNLRRPSEIPSNRKLCAEIISAIKETPAYERSVKQLSLGVRSALKIGKKDSALKFTDQLLEKSSVDTFEYAKLVRDIEDEWSQDQEDLTKGSILASLYLRRTVEPSLEIVQPLPGHQDRQGNLLFHLDLTEDLMLSASSMIRTYRIAIERLTGDPLGSGFLIRGGSLNLEDDDSWHAVTNAHVISEDDNEWKGTPPASPLAKAFAFPKWTKNKGLKLKEILHTSPRSEFDFTVASFTDNLSDFEEFRFENLPFPQLAQHIPIKGASLVGLFGSSRNIGAVQLGRLDREEDGRIYYNMETFAGYSGGPILTNDGKILGLHSAKPPEEELRRGVFIQSLIKGNSLFT